jgi:hypothetical protein
MAIFTVTNGESTNLSVVKVTPVVQDCFTLYEYIVTTNNGDNITLNLTGNHFEAVYKRNGLDTSFNDNASFVYSNTLSVRFLLLNSGINNVFSSATIIITNTTTGFFYDNFVQRNNDGANCYNSLTVPTKTSQLLNDGQTGVNTYVENDEVILLTGNQSATGIKTFTSNILTRLSFVSDDDYWTLFNITTGNVDSLGLSRGINGPTGSLTALYSFNLSGTPTGSTDVVTKSYLDAEITAIGTVLTDASDITFDSYLTIGSTNVQDAIEELKDELDAAVIGSFTLDLIPTDSSTNGVESNGIFDALATKGNLNSTNTWTSLNLYNNGLTIGLTGLGLEFYNSGGTNIIDTNASGLVIRTDNLPTAWLFNVNGSLVGSGSSTIYSSKITVDNEAYSSGWNGSTEVPTKDAIYDKIETLGGSAISISGTPADNQLTVWTNATTVEGTSGLTYNGSNFQVTGDIGSTGTRITKGWFTNLEVTNTIIGSIDGNAATVTSIGNLTGDVTSVNRATTISAGAVDISMLSASGTANSSTFLRGDNTWATPAGSGDVSKVGTPVNNQLGIWTGDGTIEGDSNITWNGSVLNITGTIDASVNIISPLVTLFGTNPLRIVGNSTGDTNISTISFYESNNSIRKGYVGDASAANSDIYLGSDAGGVRLLTGGSSRYIVDSLGEHIFSGTTITSNISINVVGSTTENKFLQIGIGRSGNGNSFIDLVGDATYSDYGTRLIRNAGPNSTSDLIHRGTGALRVIALDAASVILSTNNTPRVQVTSSGGVQLSSITGSATDIMSISNIGDIGRLTYRTGTFTCTAQGSTSGTYIINSSDCRYNQIGTLVIFCLTLNLTGIAPLGTLQILPSGLPTIAGTNYIYSVRMAASSVGTSNGYSFIAVPSGGARWDIERQSALDSSNAEKVTNADFTSGSITFSGTYFTT